MTEEIGFLEELLENIDIPAVLIQSELMKERVNLMKATDSERESTRRRPGSRSLSIPKIVKRDIRRRYLAMFCNVMNSYDFELIDSFFRRFCLPDVKLVSEQRLGPLTPYLELRGVDVIVDYHSAMLQTSPDKVTRAFEIKLRQNSDSPGKVEIFGHFSVSHTSFYATNPFFIAEKLQELYREDDGRTPVFLNQKPRLAQPPLDTLEGDGPAQKRRKSEESLAVRSFDVANRKEGSFATSQHFERLSHGQPFQVRGILSLLVNEDRRIERINCVPLELGFVTEKGLVPLSL